jgi:hypothetical protein
VTELRRDLLLAFAGLVAIAVCPLAPARAEILVGAAKRVITPNPLLPVSGGIGRPHPVHEKKGDLMTRAVVLRKGNVTVAIVSVDNIGFPSVLGDRIRERVGRIPPKNILIGATHTHSAPDCYGFPDGQGGHTGDLHYMEFVCDKAAEALNEALDHLVPCRLKIATGEAKGKIAYNYYAPQLYDKRMSVIQAQSLDGKNVATLVNYAIHPEVLGDSKGVLSPDLVGPLCDKLEADTGGMAIFMNGAQGGMITADNRLLDKPSSAIEAKWHDARTWDECLRIGHLMADEAQRIVKDAPAQDNPQLVCDSLDVEFPIENPVLWMITVGSPLKYPHNDANHSVTCRLNLINLGNAQIATIPGEALPNIGFYLKRKMRGEHNLLFGLTNDAFGYILTRVDFHSFPRYDYVSRTSLGENTGEILIENILKLVAKNAPPEHLATK